MPSLRPVLLLSAAFCAGCGGGNAPSSTTTVPPVDVAHVDPFDVNIGGVTSPYYDAFNNGDIAFDTPLRDGDGLGPLYTRASCDSCHADGVRGPGLVQKMSVVEADGITPSPDQSELPFGHTEHPLTAGGGKTPVLPPDDPNIKVTIRVGPPVLGRGYMDAVLDSEIERVEAEQATRTDAIHGKINHVVYASQTVGDPAFNTATTGETLIGRFGLKARIATIDEFVADAFQGDMGITSPLRPVEIPNPDGLTDDDKPGIDVELDSVTDRATYVRLLAIPARHDDTDAQGTALFASTVCAACHVPTLKTRSDYGVADLAGIDAPVYTDFLLHDMGDDLADGLPASPAVDGEADSFEWRTAPLIGLRFNKTFLHDGRAKTVEDAIEMHRGTNSEANASIDAFDALSAADRQSLIDYVTAL